MFEVRLKQRHPTGVRHRAGMVFSKEAVQMEIVPKSVREDDWLVVTRLPEPKRETKTAKEPPPAA